MANDAERPGGLPDPLAWAIELPDEEAPAGPSYDWWLAVVAVVYPIVGFGMLLFGGGHMGPAGFGFWFIALPPLVVSAAAIGAWQQGVPLHWASVIAFVGWIWLVAVMQFEIWASAVAAI